MNISYEFSKIKDAFRKAKLDVDFLSKKITENYEEFIKSHNLLKNEISFLVSKVENIITQKIEKPNMEKKEYFELNLEIKDLKKEIEKFQIKHNLLQEKLEEVEKNSKSNFNIGKIEKRVDASQLEIYLLEEKLKKKDVEIKQIQDINRHIFNLLEDLSKVEMENRIKN